MSLRCTLFGHDYVYVVPDPRPVEYVTAGPRAGRRKLRRAFAVCRRCGVTNE